MGFYHSPRIITDGLAFLVDGKNSKSYPGSGSALADLSLNQNTLTITGTTTVDGDGILQFTGGSTANSLMSTAFANSGKTTMCVWYKRDDTNASSSWRTIFGDSGANVHPMIVHQTTREIGLFDGSWRSYGYTVPNDGQFHHYAVVLENAVDATLFVDGISTATIAIVLNIGTTNNIGRVGNWNSGTYYAGPLNLPMIYSRELSPSEILQNYNATRSRFQ